MYVLTTFKFQWQKNVSSRKVFYFFDRSDYDDVRTRVGTWIIRVIIDWFWGRGVDYFESILFFLLLTFVLPTRVSKQCTGPLRAFWLADFWNSSSFEPSQLPTQVSFIQLSFVCWSQNRTLNVSPNLGIIWMATILNWPVFILLASIPLSLSLLKRWRPLLDQYSLSCFWLC